MVAPHVGVDGDGFGVGLEGLVPSCELYVDTYLIDEDGAVGIRVSCRVTWGRHRYRCNQLI